MLGDGAKLDTLGFHKDEQAQRKSGKGQLIAGIGHGFDGLLGYIHKRCVCDILHQEESIIKECTKCIQQSIHKGHAEGNNGQLFAVGLLSRGFTAVFQIADTHNTNGDHANGKPGEPGEFIAHKHGKQKDANHARSILNGVRDGLLQETHTKIGKCHGDDIKQRDGQIDQYIDGIVVDILGQQGEDGVKSHDNANPDADLQMGILLIRQCTLFVKQFRCAPQKRGCYGKE